MLQPLTDLDLSKLYFGMFTETKINGVPVWLTRTGYTGEDGFEISLLNTDTVALTKKLLENPRRACAASAPAIPFDSKLACASTATISTRPSHRSRLV